MASDPKTCLFCGAFLRPKRSLTGGKTDEHIIPEWLMTHMGMLDLPFTSERVDVPSGQAFGRRQHSVRNFVAGRVCSNCNNGWMSQLESLARPILIRLIADPHELSALTQEERHIIARWTFKTAVVLNRASSWGNRDNVITHPVPDEHLRIVMSGEIPDDVIVVGSGLKSDRPADMIQNATWASPRDSVDLLNDDRDRSYKIGFSFRSLLLGVAYYPNREYAYRISARSHVLLWSGHRRIIRNEDGVGEVPITARRPILEGFLGNVAVVSKTWWDLRQNIVNTRFIVPGRLY